MDVLKEILDWSSTRPAWQRDALRRLVTQGKLQDSDLEELVALCKVPHGLAERREPSPLAERHIPSRGAGLDVVKLTSLTHHRGVNALAAGQTIKFGPELTIVYGGNAAGKSGYTRILKRACRARGAEEILGNVLVEVAPARPSATIRFAVGDENRELAWSDQEEPQEALGHVSVFDHHCAAVYLRKKTDVAFRPFGLELFDKLSDACEEVRRVLEKERSELATQQVALPELPDGTAAHKLVSNITSLTKPEDVKKLGTLSEAERDRLKQLQKRLQDLQSDDPEKAARLLTLRAQRLETLSSHLTELDEVLADRAVKSLFEARDEVQKASSVAEELRATTFPLGLLKGTGSDLWRELWEAARRFSTESAYPERQFPVTEEEARCVLCQQELGKDAGERLQQFEAFLRSTIQQKLDEATATYQERRQRLDSLAVTDDPSQGALAELRIEAEELGKSVQDCFAQARLRRDLIAKALQEGRPMPSGLPIYESNGEQVLDEAGAIHKRAEQLLRNSDQEAKDKLVVEQRELEARETLGKNLKAVLDGIERKKKFVAYEVCLKDTGTKAITRKSTDLTTRVVTRRLADSFKDNLGRLGFTHLEVELQAAGGARGTLYHKLVLKRASGVDLPRIVSEGEARTLSIGAFFAELSTATNRSAILFDDPVSSLDHEWRDYVARRLAEEAKNRQVIVFTHDIVFMLALVSRSRELGVDCQHQHVRRETHGAGVSSPELPWVAMKVKDRIGVLKNNWQQAEKLHRTATLDQYEREAVYIYGRLREAWERALEEVLLGGVVERYRPGVQTQQAKHLSDITKDDCEALEAGMTKCSRWLHDQAPAENVPVPDPAEVKSDIAAFETWVKTIRKRRNQ